MRALGLMLAEAPAFGLRPLAHLRLSPGITAPRANPRRLIDPSASGHGLAVRCYRRGRAGIEIPPARPTLWRSSFASSNLARSSKFDFNTRRVIVSVAKSECGIFG